jgi:hypothetical protein
MPQIVRVIREIDLAKYFLYAVWVLPIFRVYRAYAREGSLGVWRFRSFESPVSARVAVLIPARNSSSYIGQVVRSIVRQRLRPEIVVIID